MALDDAAVVPSAAHFDAETLMNVGRTVLERWGVPADLAEATAMSLAEANLLGHDSHGILRLVQYAEWVRNGQIVPDVRPVVSRAQGSVVVVDGAWGLGQPAARLATQALLAATRQHGVAVATIQRCNHIGRLGEYVADLAAGGCVALAFCNSGPVVAAAGGTERMLGTNPFAWAAPRGTDPPFVLDFSTAAMAEGKLRVARSLGLPVPPGVIVDRAGVPSDDPADFYAGGAILPFGGHKGAGLCFMIELVGGLLSGMGCAPMPDYQGGNGTVMIALSVAAFGDAMLFAAGADALADTVRSAGSEVASSVRLPGDVESATRADRARAGVAVPDTVRREVTTVYDGDPADLGGFALVG